MQVVFDDDEDVYSSNASRTGSARKPTTVTITHGGTSCLKRLASTVDVFCGSKELGYREKSQIQANMPVIHDQV